MIDFTKLKNPIIDRRPQAFVRDAALIYHDGVLRCFHTTAEEKGDDRNLYLEVSITEDFVDWQTTRLTTSNLNFSSPGNIIRHNGKWVLCVQSYPINKGELWGNDNSRLWLMSSFDLINWSEPEVMVEEGCLCSWVTSPRQIDPYLVLHENEYYCFYKAESKLGAVKSADLKSWQEVSPDQPIIAHADIPDKRAIENPCIIKDDNGRYVLFFSPCREGRGVGIAYSDNLIQWEGFKYLDLPELPWAPNGITAPVVIDMRLETGCWLMIFHGEDVSEGHSSALGVAWSENLLDWQFANGRI
ncbi:MAG: glycoside hydrolase family protein [Planctomycetota bacterium]